MAELIECRECTSPYCRGCNIYILSRALHDGKFNGLMNANKLVVVPKEISPVRHGRWNEESPDCLDGDSVYVCSVCGETWTLIEGTPLDNNMHYCPNCGCRMDLEASDGK